MAVKEFYKLLKEKDLQEIIYMHCFEKITLTDKQLDKILDLKKKRRLKIGRINLCLFNKALRWLQKSYKSERATKKFWNKRQ